MSEREDNLYIAKLAGAAERYNDMLLAMKNVVLMDVELTVEENNLLSFAYQNEIGARRKSWRIITKIEQNEESKGATKKLEIIRSYRAEVEKELRAIITDILNLLEKHLIPCSTTGQNKAFLYKMKGDYYRYAGEFATGSDRSDAGKNSLLAYKYAYGIAKSCLPTTHPIRLGLALNFSVLYYETLNSPDLGYEMAKEAFDDAYEELDALSEKDYKESADMMQLLRDNLTLWADDIRTHDDDVKIEAMQNVEDDQDDKDDQDEKDNQDYNMDEQDNNMDDQDNNMDSTYTL